MTRIDDLVAPDWRPAQAGTGSRALDRDGFCAPRWADIRNGGLDDAWDALARCAVTPNPFFERWFLAPSLDQFDPDGRVRIAMLVDKGRLVALMPVCSSAQYHGRRLPHLAGWRHHNLFCGEPLIAPGHAERFWSALLDWCDTHERASLFAHWPALPTDGASLPALRAVCGQTARTMRVVASQQRAALLRGATPDEHLQRCLERKRRKELGRKRRRLEELGELRFTRHQDGANLDAWVDDFLALELAGWKGTQGSALASAPETTALFRASLAGAARDNRLERLAFHLDGRPIAMLCNFIAPPLSFAFKTTYDESLAKLSPGVLLQVENLALLERGDIALSDSCAAPGHPMIDHIWLDRREIVKVSVAIGGMVRRTIGAALTAIEVHRSEKRA